MATMIERIAAVEERAAEIAGNGAIIFSFPESDKEILNNILGQLERIGQLYDIHTQLHMIHIEQQTKPFLRHFLQ